MSSRQENDTCFNQCGRGEERKRNEKEKGKGKRSWENEKNRKRDNSPCTGDGE